MFLKKVPRVNAQADRLTVIAVVMTKPVPAEQPERLASEKARQDFLRAQIEYERQRVEALGSGGRLRTIWSKYALDNSLGYDCYRSDSMTEDAGVPGAAGEIFTTDIHTLTCLDPESKFLASFGYSERVPPGAAAVDITTEGEAFLRGFRFAGMAQKSAG